MASEQGHRVFRWFTKSTTLQLRIIVAGTVIGLALLVATGVSIALAWPADWNSMLGSLLLSVVASLIGVMLAILVAILVVEGYLERRRHQAAQEAEREERHYKAGWSIYVHAGIATMAWILMQASLFVAYGKDKYLEANEEMTFQAPDTISEFFPALYQYMKTSMDEEPKSLPEGSAKSQEWSEERATRLREAFQEKPSVRTVTRQDLSVLVSQLHGMEIYLRGIMYLLLPYMSRYMGVASSMTDISQYLSRTIEQAKDVLASGVVSDEPTASIDLGSDFLSAYCELGRCSIEARRMIGAGRKDLNIVIEPEPASQGHTPAE